MSQERRLNTRKTPKHLAYLSLPMNKGGIVVDVSEGGLGFRSIAPLQADGPIHFRFAIDSGNRIKAVGELAWKDETGKIGGLRFTQLSDEAREQIRAWASETNKAASGLANPEANGTIQDVQVVDSALQEEAAVHGKADLASGEDTGRPLLYNLKPPIYSAPFNSLSMFPVDLNSEAAAAAVVPQLIQLFDGIREQVRDWAGQANAGVYDNPFADPAFEDDVARQKETGLAPAVDIEIAHPPPESEDALTPKADLGPARDGAGAEPAAEPEAAPGSLAEFESIVAAGNPLLYNLKPPVYRAPFNPLSLFPSVVDSEIAATGDGAAQFFAVPAPGAIPVSIVTRHPVAAIAVTIALAFVVSMVIIVYASTSRTGQLLLDRGVEIWGGSYSQPSPQNAAPPARRSPDFLQTLPH